MFYLAVYSKCLLNSLIKAFNQPYSPTPYHFFIQKLNLATYGSLTASAKIVTNHFCLSFLLTLVTSYPAKWEVKFISAKHGNCSFLGESLEVNLMVSSSAHDKKTHDQISSEQAILEKQEGKIEFFVHRLNRFKHNPFKGTVV
ncbi:hypothetical protein R6Q59_002299 [Mikania micrantha]